MANPRFLPTFISSSLRGNIAEHPSRCNCWTTQKMLIDQRHHHHRHHHGNSILLQRMANDPFYGLTDDGDFAMFGVNIEETATSGNAFEDDEQVSPDISSIMSGITFSGVAGENTKEPTQSTGASMEFNTGDAMSLNNAIFGRLPENALDANLSHDTTKKSVSNPNEGSLAADDIPSSVEDRVLPSNDTSQQQISDIEDWLLTIMPKLGEKDIEVYARGLIGIGFHPECVTMCELKYEDLDFMRILHRRFLFNEVTGIEHPWEV